MSKTGSALISLLMLHFETIELTAEKRGGSMKQVIHDSRARLYLRKVYFESESCQAADREVSSAGVH